MRRINPRADTATECLEAVRLARDLARLQQAPDCELVTTAAVLAKGLLSVIDGGGLRPQRAQALDLLDNAGRAIGDELQVTINKNPAARAGCWRVAPGLVGLATAREAQTGKANAEKGEGGGFGKRCQTPTWDRRKGDPIRTGGGEEAVNSSVGIDVESHDLA